MLADALTGRATQIVALAGLGWVTWTVWSYVTSPLRKYPGPFLAGWTNLWRLYHVLMLDAHHVVERLHRKHGPVVRIGPNLLSLEDPSLIKKIYKFDDDWVKTEFYHGGSSRTWTGDVKYNLFGMSNKKDYAKYKRPIGKLYNTSTALQAEGHIDTAIQLFCSELETRFIDGENAKKAFSLDDWLLYLAADVIGGISFSQPTGYLKSGTDFDGTLADTEMAMTYLNVVGQLPMLDYFAAQNPLLKLFVTPPFTTANNFANARIKDRLAGKDRTHNPARPDFLDGFIEAQKAYPDIVDEPQLQGYLLINVIAGSDTTASTMAGIFYFLLKHPQALARLETELLSASLPSPSSKEPIPYTQAQKLPYLHAVIRETMRLHPAVGMPLERYVPASGLSLPDGSFVPGGTAVGMNPFIVNRTAPFGEGPGAFWPERWLRGEGESEEDFKARLGAMNDADLSFGAGSRMCAGRHIANVEMYKVVATLVTRYCFELVEPEKEWTVRNGWFMRAKGVNVRVSRR